MKKAKVAVIHKSPHRWLTNTSSIYGFWLPIIQTLLVLEWNKDNNSTPFFNRKIVETEAESIPLTYIFTIYITLIHVYGWEYRGELRCSGRISSSCSISGTRRVNLVTNPVICNESWSFVTQIIHNGQPCHGSDLVLLRFMDFGYPLYKLFLYWSEIKITIPQRSLIGKS
jgi:hypothetical protein